MNTLIALPILWPLAIFTLCVLLRHRPQSLRTVSVTGALGLVAIGVLLVERVIATDAILVSHMGGWSAPFGISLVIDRLSAALVLITGIIGLATVLYGLAPDRDAASGGYFHLFVHGLLAGVCGAFITGDVFNLYVWFEVSLIGSFALMALGGGRHRLAGATVYLVLNLLATVIFLLAAGILYGAAGSLNMADLAARFHSGEAPPGATAAAVLMMLAFAIKAALFPVFGWLPASYHTAWTPVSALFAGLLTKVGVYALIRLVTLFWPEAGPVHQWLLWIACLTMIVGVLGAAAQKEVRRILSFHIVSQVGYMILGLALATPLALAGAVFYLIHHIVVKANLFFVGGLAARMAGSERLAAMGGLYANAPWLAILFAIPALSLAGIPPLSGFWAKFLIVKASLDAHMWWAAAAALLTGLFTILSMSKIWNEAFMKARPEGDAAVPQWAHGWGGAVTAMGMLALITVAIGLGAGPVMEFAEASARELANPQGYIRAVLGANGTGG